MPYLLFDKNRPVQHERAEFARAFASATTITGHPEMGMNASAVDGCRAIRSIARFLTKLLANAHPDAFIFAKVLNWDSAPGLFSVSEAPVSSRKVGTCPDRESPAPIWTSS